MKQKILQSILTKKFLIKNYLEEKKSIWEIGKIINCNGITIYNYLKKYNIKCRNRRDGAIVFWGSERGKQVIKKFKKHFKGKNNPNYGNHKLIGKNNPKYIDGRSINNHCIDCDKEIDYRSIRCRECDTIDRKKRVLFENNPNWRNGKSFEDYPEEFNDILKELIRKRDNYICQLCKLKQKDYYQKLSVHHIDYDKKNNKPENLITLCRGCNAKANSNRNYWRDYFKCRMN